jgi:hypothetical protein
MNISALKQPSAWLPIAMSLVALTVVLGHVALRGAAGAADEGAGAHIWQMLMAAQLPIIAFFAFRWLPREPRQAASVLALQVATAFTAVAPVYFLGL